MEDQAGLGQARTAPCRRQAAVGAAELPLEQCSGVLRVLGVLRVVRVVRVEERGQGVAGGKGQIVDLDEDRRVRRPGG